MLTNKGGVTLATTRKNFTKFFTDFVFLGTVFLEFVILLPNILTWLTPLGQN